MNRESQTQDHRADECYPLSFPVQINGGQLGTAVGRSRDASAKGLCADVNAEMTVGAPVRVRFRVSPRERPQDFDGTVTRIERNDSAGSQWPYQLAVKFDQPNAALAARLQAEFAHLQPASL